MSFDVAQDMLGGMKNPNRVGKFSRETIGCVT